MDDSLIPMHCDASGHDGGVALKKRKPRAKRAAAASTTAAMAELAAVAGAGTPTTIIHGAVEASPLAVPQSTEVSAARSDEPQGDPHGTLVDSEPIPADAVYQRIGHLTRTLHDALRELGYDKELQGTRDQLPDARDRLTYIARVTGEAAEKVLNAVDRARVVQEQMTATANDLRTRWLAVAAYAANDAARATPAGRDLIDQTCAFFAGVDSQTDITKAILTDIMMAQDFHDLTGQVIRKVVMLAQNMEEQLLKLLIETTPPEQRRKIDPEKLEGPVVKAEGRDDVVTDQAGVDDLLASLGF
jgi:chemotaxis protein CheZ